MGQIISTLGMFVIVVCVLIYCRLNRHIDTSFEFVNISSDLPSLAEIQSSYVSLRQICMPRMMSLQTSCLSVDYLL